ncbi:LOW QUALITY PROTEIN: hypothetical protein BRADI_1g16595v3 [Brachypodium distachyon]|uniref:PHD-type domain-containing protein n=1 Tax=Brachypodium distachyon TaxID=15368 RepID=A0A0Q3GUB6_BRADI|nr:LOW QUALITY PROTEIN: hypothetical protein BRADI_1g16595v3 [Brachypodium distachyon]
MVKAQNRSPDGCHRGVHRVHGERREGAPAPGELRRKAKEQLLSCGWSLWTAIKYNGRAELRYRAPHGASSASLIVACKKHHQDITAPAAPPASSSSRSSTRRRTAPPLINPPSPSPPSSSSSDEENKKRTVRTAASSKRSTRATGNGSSDLEEEEVDNEEEEEESCVAADPSYAAPGECTTRSKKRRRVSAISAGDAALKKKKKASAASASLAKATGRVLRPRLKDGGDKKKTEAVASCQPSRGRTILAVLMDKTILKPTDKLITCRRTRDGPPLKSGVMAGDGIMCTCGCRRAFSVADFNVHAIRNSRSSSNRTSPPSARLFLKDGRSLLECLVQLMRMTRRSDGAEGPPVVRVKKQMKWSSELQVEDGDWVCSVCADGMLLCDCCPSAFHHACIGLDATPPGEWFCPPCRCTICDSGHFDNNHDHGFTDKTVILCDQCELEYHVGCVKNRGGDHQLECCPEVPWLCSQECSEISQHLQGLVGKSIPTSEEGLSFTVLRSPKHPEEEDDAMAAEEHGKLCMAFDVLHECFVTLVEPHTQSDLSQDIVFNRESWLRRLYFRGFYIIGLEKGGELITVGTLRVYGKKVAELPLVGTRFTHRRQGMCHLLMNQLEMLLGEWGVERLVLPAVPELLQTWTGSFGFQVMTQSQKLDIAQHTIMCFQGTTMCHKFITNTAAPQRRNILLPVEIK